MLLNFEPDLLRGKVGSIKINSLVFADEFAILLESTIETAIYINLLETIGDRTELRIPIENTKFITNIKDGLRNPATEIGRIERGKEVRLPR